MAVFLPLSCVYTVAIAGTRGFGTMMPNALIDRVARSSLQLLLVVAVLLVGDRPSAIAVAWSLPFAAGLVAAAIWLARLLHRVERRAAAAPQEPATPLRRLYGEFWRYTAPRGLTGAFQITIVWVGTLMVGSLLSTSSASVYTASTRYLVAGGLVNTAILQVIAPKLAELLSAGLGDRAKDVYQLATACLITIAWPMYFTLALFAPVLLSAFGHDYSAGVSSLAILSVAMLVATGIGPVDIVLLMGGRSSWNLFNVVVALILNLVLGLILVPRIGIAGAAVGLAGAILFNNVAPLVEVRAFLKVHPFGRAFVPVAASAALCFGGIGAGPPAHRRRVRRGALRVPRPRQSRLPGDALRLPRAHRAPACSGRRSHDVLKTETFRGSQARIPMAYWSVGTCQSGIAEPDRQGSSRLQFPGGISVPSSRPRRWRLRATIGTLTVLAAAALATSSVGAAPTGPVSGTPALYTPQLANTGTTQVVRQMVQCGNTMYAVGSFTTIQRIEHHVHPQQRLQLQRDLRRTR